jgi:DNA-binding transcriptional ArsR family regulator
VWSILEKDRQIFICSEYVPWQMTAMTPDVEFPESWLKRIKAGIHRQRLTILMALAACESKTKSKCLSFSSLLKELGSNDGKGKSTLVYHLKILEGAGLIVGDTREQPENPGSYRVYRLTDDGARLLRDVMKIDNQQIEDMSLTGSSGKSKRQ